MTFQPIKVVRRRRLDTKRAKRQQQTRRKDNLFKKAREYSLECGAHVYLAIKIKKNGRIFTFNSDSTGEWPLPEAQMVRQLPECLGAGTFDRHLRPQAHSAIRLLEAIRASA